MSTSLSRAPWWFWAVSLLFLLLNLVACWGYWAEMTLSYEAYLEAYGKVMTDLRGETPWWSISGYAIGVWGGLAGTILLLLRKKLCLPFFYASFIGAIVGWSWNIIDMRFRDAMGTAGWVFMILIWLECIFIIWFARRMRTKNIID